MHLLSLVAHESGLTLAQTAVPNGGENKTNEHKTALRLLEGIVLEGRLVTGDAMFCQRDLSQQVIDAQGHYLWFVKENQPTLLNDIKMAFAPSVEGAFSPSTATNLGEAPWTRRRPSTRDTVVVERRTLKATTALNEYLDWPGVAQVGQIESEVSRTARPHARPATSSPAFRGSWRTPVNCSNGHEATGRSRIAPTTCVTSPSGRTRAGSARVPAPK